MTVNVDETNPAVVRASDAWPASTDVAAGDSSKLRRPRRATR